MYGSDARARNQRELLRLLSAAGQAGQLQEFTAGGATLAAGGVWGLWSLGKQLFRLPAPVLVGVGAIAAVAGARLPAERRAQLHRAGLVALEFAAEYGGLDADLREQVAAAHPLAPDDEEQGMLARGPRLVRELMWTMARQPSGQQVVSGIVDQVGLKLDPPAPSTVRSALRRHSPGTFIEVYQGEWQLGRCLRAAQG